MTPAASVAFFRPELDDFLHASIGEDGNGMPLSVLLALARLDVDPWQEASELSELPKDNATQRLASLIARLPGGRWAQADCGVISNRLLELLPHRGSWKVALAQEGHSHPQTVHSVAAKIVFCAVLGLTALFISASLEPSSRSDQSDVPAISTRFPSQH